MGLRAKLAKGKKPALDLAKLQLAYESSPATLEALGKVFGVTKGRVSQLASANGWARGGNLERVRAKAQAKVEAAEAVAAAVEAGTEQAVDATAQVMADVILRQRRDVRGMTALAARMGAELIESQQLAEDLAAKPVKGKSAMQLADRIDGLRKLGATMDTLVKLERNVFGITPDTPVDPARRIAEEVDAGLAGIRAKFAQVLGKASA